MSGKFGRQMFSGEDRTSQDVETVNGRTEGSHASSLPTAMTSDQTPSQAAGNGLVTTLIARFDQRLRRYLTRCVGTDASEDALHDVYARLTRLAQGDPPPDFNLTYVFKTANSVLGDLYRRRRTREGNNHIELDDSLTDEGPSPFEALRWRQNKDLLLKALRQLRPEERVVLIMHRIEGVKLTDISKKQGIPLRTVQRLLADALAKCRITLKDSGWFEL
jgi:RNA polymerase sigma factor (sigma-70 family)